MSRTDELRGNGPSDKLPNTYWRARNSSLSRARNSRAEGQMQILFDLAVIVGWTIAVYVAAHFY